MINTTPSPAHITGTVRGEELCLSGKEPGRAETNRRNYRTARDATGINAAHRQPILPDMPNLPPA